MSIPEEVIIGKIFNIREEKVMLDKDLASLYGVETIALKQAVKRNIDIFPKHFMFELNAKEFESLRSQNVTSNSRGGIRYLPMVFTEHGILQLSTVLRSKRARHMSIRIIEVFVKIRKMILSHKDILLKVEEIDKKYSMHDRKIEMIFNYLKQFVQDNEKPRRKIGFKQE